MSITSVVIIGSIRIICMCIVSTRVFAASAQSMLQASALSVALVLLTQFKTIPNTHRTYPQRRESHV